MNGRRRAAYLFFGAAAFFVLAGFLQMTASGRSGTSRVAPFIGYAACAVLYIVVAINYLKQSKQ